MPVQANPELRRAISDGAWPSGLPSEQIPGPVQEFAPPQFVLHVHATIRLASQIAPGSVSSGMLPFARMENDEQQNSALSSSAC